MGRTKLLYIVRKVGLPPPPKKKSSPLKASYTEMRSRSEECKQENGGKLLLHVETTKGRPAGESLGSNMRIFRDVALAFGRHASPTSSVSSFSRCTWHVSEMLRRPVSRNPSPLRFPTCCSINDASTQRSWSASLCKTPR